MISNHNRSARCVVPIQSIRPTRMKCKSGEYTSCKWEAAAQYVQHLKESVTRETAPVLNGVVVYNRVPAPPGAEDSEQTNAIKELVDECLQFGGQQLLREFILAARSDVLSVVLSHFQQMAAECNAGGDMMHTILNPTGFSAESATLPSATMNPQQWALLCKVLSAMPSLKHLHLDGLGVAGLGLIKGPSPSMELESLSLVFSNPTTQPEMLARLMEGGKPADLSIVGKPARSAEGDVPSSCLERTLVPSLVSIKIAGQFQADFVGDWIREMKEGRCTGVEHLDVSGTSEADATGWLPQYVSGAKSLTTLKLPAMNERELERLATAVKSSGSLRSVEIEGVASSNRHMQVIQQCAYRNKLSQSSYV
ncbi:hypothetical protein [Variovorax sp. KK3]|uniref:hypothetical protein n=1 Tax=Variovorax sp. KK3 TaxID=1855728 RepID=UPI00097C501B|nr:hypothetical protein [Variovorax sp. KK3]